jgi:NAD(P)-dependent dehydrogenase (short-subunit alcohol dehydrogenase family)
MGQAVIITGANRGIGLSLCKLYKNRGDVVYAVCRSASPALEQLGVQLVEGIDVSQASSMEKLKNVMAEVSIDLLINNAGVLRRELLGDIDYDIVRQQFEINAMGPLRVTEALLTNLSADAKVAFITSRMGSMGDNSSGGRYGYRMSKAALNSAGVSLANDLKPRGIAVAILHPGLVGTDMINGQGDISPDQAAERLARRIDEVNVENSGSFWHSNGEILPW